MQILVVLLALGFALTIGSYVTAGNAAFLVIILGALVVGLMAVFSPKLSLAFLVISMLLSPEIGMGAASSFRDIVVRYDDIMLVAIFLAWFGRTAIIKDKPFITSTPAQAPVLFYTALCVISTLLAVLRGDVDLKFSSFYVLKYVEYFLLFFMTVNIVESEEDVKRYLKYGGVVAIIVTLYAYWFYMASGGMEARTTAPFEVALGGDIREAEPASLGGYYLIVFGVLLGLITETSGYIAVFATLSLCAMFPAFVLTLSRSSYIGFVAMLPALFFFSGKRRLFLISFLGIVVFSVTLVPGMYTRVMNRITMTYTGPEAQQAFSVGAAGTVKLEDSAAARVNSIRKAFLYQLPAHPVLGCGVTAVGLGDTQYALVLGELGLSGAIIFTWMLLRLFKTARTVFRGSTDPQIRALSLGFMTSLVGLLFQSVGVNSFVIVRIMEPFWFCAAMLGVLYMQIEARERALKSAGVN